MIHRPGLTGDAARNRRVLQEVLDSASPGKLELPPGEHPIADGLRVPGGWTVRGASVAGANGSPPSSWLVGTGTTGHPVLHVQGSDVSVSDLGLKPPPADPGAHGGDSGTAITIGDYLYPAVPEWIQRVDVRRVHVSRPGAKHANCIAIMGAVRHIRVHDVTIRGGHTGVAVHWGAVGADVSSLVGPTFHPHHLNVTDLRVRDAIEGFYLSSVHDVSVLGCCLRDVDMGFRLLPGDNTDRFVPSTPATSAESAAASTAAAGASTAAAGASTAAAGASTAGQAGVSPAASTAGPAAAEIGARIEIADACVRGNGPDYGVRVAGWGRSEVDGLVSVLAYSDAVIRDCHLVGAGSGDAWSPVLVERADGVELRDIRVGTLPPAVSQACCALGGRV
jgi:hypothetical protein